MKEVADEVAEQPVTITEKPLMGTFGRSYSSARQESDHIAIEVPEQTELPTKKSVRQLAQSILAIFEIALLERNKEAQRRKFADLLFGLMRRW